LKKKLQVDRTKQQLIFRNLCEEALKIQSNRIKEQRDVFKEKKLATLERQKKELENLENQWRDGLNILSENTKQDKNDYLVKTKAHQEELRR